LGFLFLISCSWFPNLWFNFFTYILSGMQVVEEYNPKNESGIISTNIGWLIISMCMCMYVGEIVAHGISSQLIPHKGAMPPLQSDKSQNAPGGWKQKEKGNRRKKSCEVRIRELPNDNKEYTKARKSRTMSMLLARRRRIDMQCELNEECSRSVGQEESVDGGTMRSILERVIFCDGAHAHDFARLDGTTRVLLFNLLGGAVVICRHAGKMGL
jgi:hypothetical protein